MWSVPKYLFKLLCTIATLALIGRGLYDYLLDNDASVVETRSFFQTEDDKFPTISLCFEQHFDDKLFTQYNENIKGSDYKNYLLGKYFEERFNSINYDSVTTNLSEHIFAYSFTYRNGTHVRGSRDNTSWKEPYHSYSWESWGRFVKCFAIEMTDKDLYHLAIYIKRDIFADGLRPQSNGFVVLFHYPHQVLSSLHTVMRQWKLRDNTTNYWMEFDVKNVDVIVRRYKRRLDNCIEDWKNYDDIVLMKHIESVKCKTPDQIMNVSFPLCSSKAAMKKARFNLKPGGVRPCKEVESINYVMLESEGSPTHLKQYSLEFQTWFQKALDAAFIQNNPPDKINGDQDHSWLSIVLRILDPSVKTTINKRDFDFENFIAFAGGYIGLLLGFSLAEIPEVLYYTYFYYKRFKSKLQAPCKDEKQINSSDFQIGKIEKQSISEIENTDFNEKRMNKINILEDDDRIKDVCFPNSSDVNRRINRLEKKVVAIEFFEKTVQKIKK